MKSVYMHKYNQSDELDQIGNEEVHVVGSWNVIQTDLQETFNQNPVNGFTHIKPAMNCCGVLKKHKYLYLSCYK